MSACPCPKHPTGCYGHPFQCGCADVEKTKDAEIGALRARLAEVEGERDEAVNWTATVEKHGTDAFDDLAEAWLKLEAIKRVTKAVTSTFAKWANDDLMDRFRKHQLSMFHMAFVEGCLAGVKASESRATSAEETVRGLREGLEPFAALIEAMDRDNVAIGRAGNDDPQVSDAEVAALVLPDNQVMVSQGTLAFGRPGPRPESKKVYASDFRRARSLTERRDG